jgi:hypothetical protein
MFEIEQWGREKGEKIGEEWINKIVFIIITK